LGLVDQLGDFDDAIAAAVELAKLDSYELRWMEEPLSPAELLLQEFASEASAKLATIVFGQVPAALRPVTQQVVTDFTTLSNFNDPKGQYAFCLNCSNIEK
ncbi:signal peptide peptidase SppA, partial [Photobacterium sp. OFAV2-7]|nr:signal peptide peptidase SppA [Photobacterium sp. OFAV2-7]